jgi:hypothetical protein
MNESRQADLAAAAGASVAPGGRASQAEPADIFDIPIILPLAFWTALFGVVLERTHILIGTLRAARSLAGPLNFFIISLGSFLLNFSVLLCAVLMIYYLVKEIGSGETPRRVAGIAAGLFALASAAVALLVLIVEATVVVFLSSQIFALIASLILLLLSLPGLRRPVAAVLLILPVLSFLLLQVNQICFFFPYVLPSAQGPVLPAVFLFAGQLVFLVFAGLASWRALRWTRRNGLPLFLPFLVALSTLVVSSISILASEKARAMFFRLIELQYALPYTFVMYPLIFTLIFFSFALLKAGRARDVQAQLMRQRTCYALGFITIGTFTPATCYEALFLLLGMVLWIHAVARWKDF